MWDRNVEASYDSATHVTYTGLVNFTNGNPGSADSGNCLVNSLLYDESSPLQVRAGATPGNASPSAPTPSSTDRPRAHAHPGAQLLIGGNLSHGQPKEVLQHPGVQGCPGRRWGWVPT